MTTFSTMKLHNEAQEERPISKKVTRVGRHASDLVAVAKVARPLCDRASSIGCNIVSHFYVTYSVFVAVLLTV